MGFIGVYRALYDYAPQAENELAISEGDLLFILEKGDDGWWKAKKKESNEDDVEPEGLIPGNYIEEATPLNQARALYDYSRQTDEELSFKEDATLNVYDISDPDWTLAGLGDEYGFVPANYVEITSTAQSLPSRSRAQTSSSINSQPSNPSSFQAQGPAAALAGIIQQGAGPSSPTGKRSVTSPSSFLPRPQQFTPEASEDEGPPPALPQRPHSEQFSHGRSRSQTYSPPPDNGPSTQSPERSGGMASPTSPRGTLRDDGNLKMSHAPAGYHLYTGHEMVEYLGKNRRMPTVLGIHLSNGLIMIAPEQSRDGPEKEWTAEKLTHYSIEGKHVFLELIKPSKSVDFHAGTKDTAQEIVSALGELAGGARMAGLREVLAAGSGSSNAQKYGRMLYEFMAQADDEVTVATGDEILVIDDTRSDEWWVVRRLKNGKEGNVPSSYVEITGSSSLPASSSGLNAGLSSVEQNRLDEEQRTRDAVMSSRASEPGPSAPLPNRQSSLSQSQKEKKRSSHKSKKSDSKSSKSRPESSRVRTWTDRSGSFKVEAEFLLLKDNKIHLHKLNGIKIAVPVSKMSVEDLDYVEQVTGISLDEEKPLSDIKRRNTQKRNKALEESESTSRSDAVASVGTPKYDWFDFFLACGVNPQICERYSSAFTRDEMGEENLADINPSLLRTLGLKEGDILRVMKYLDNKYNRPGSLSTDGVDRTEMVNGANGGLFSGPGGALKNNTRKGRPAPAVQTNDTVDGKAFGASDNNNASDATAPARATPLVSAPSKPQRPRAASSSGFDDDAWDVKPSKQQVNTAPQTAPVTPRPPTGALAELSLLSPPLQPTQASHPLAPVTSQQSASTQQEAQTGANPSFFNQLAAPAPGAQQNQPTGISQATAPRQRPQPPQSLSPNSLMPPPPLRPLSAPQNFNQPSAFAPPPLQPQLTGYLPQQQSQFAPPGQSLAELNQRRFQQPYPSQPQPFQYSTAGFNQGNYSQLPNGIQPQATGYPQFMQQSQPTGFQSFPPQIQQQFVNGQQQGSPFADPPRQPQQILQPQQTAFQSQPGFPQQQQALQPQQTSINSFLPPALQPQRTGGVTSFNSAPSPFSNQGPNQLLQPQQTSLTNGFGAPQQQPQRQFALPQQELPQHLQIAQPLVPQRTGPAPPVRFGMQPGAAPKLVPQPTGRANLMNATPQNPFGF